MKKSIAAVFMLLLSLASFAQKLPADQITGIWQCDDYKIEVFKAGNIYSAKLLWSKEMFEADGANTWTVSCIAYRMETRIVSKVN